MSDESNLALLVNEGAEGDSLNSEVLDGKAVLVPNVIVVDIRKSLLLDESIHLGLVSIDAEADSSDLSGPLGLVRFNHHLHGSDVNLGLLAHGSPHANQHNFVSFMVDGAGGDFIGFRGSLNEAHFLTDLSSAENLGLTCKALGSFPDVDHRRFAVVLLVVRENSVNVELGDLRSFLGGQIQNIGVCYHWVLEFFRVIDGCIGISKAAKELLLLLRIQISPSSSGTWLSLATSASASTTTGTTTSSSWHASATSGSHWHASCTCLPSALTLAHDWVQTLSQSLLPDLSRNLEGLFLRELSLWTVC